MDTTWYKEWGYMGLVHNRTSNNKNDNNNEVLIKREPLVLPELGALYRKKCQDSTAVITS